MEKCFSNMTPNYHGGKSFWRIGIVVYLTFGTTFAEHLLLNLDVEQPVAVTSDKFLSLTLDPAVLSSSNIFDFNIHQKEWILNMAKALSPAYFRLPGAYGNSSIFQWIENKGPILDEKKYTSINNLAEKAGLSMIIGIPPSSNNESKLHWDFANVENFIQFNDKAGYNISWQLGYECQSRCNIPAEDLGKDVIRLRNMLDAFPRYSNSIIAGPDVVACNMKQEQQFLQDYLSTTETALSAITWHPTLAGITIRSRQVTVQYDNLELEKQNLFRVIGPWISNKQFWIAESMPEEGKDEYFGAIIWARRLGLAAKLGAHVIMRQLKNPLIFRATPDYWVSLLHKTFVGREALNIEIADGNRLHVQFYCQCTKPSERYEKGSVTIFGFNVASRKVTANLKSTLIKTLHAYILSPGFDSPNQMFAETVLLNGKELTMLDGINVPEINPTIITNKEGVNLELPALGIGFWVIPEFKVQLCLDNTMERTKHLNQQPLDNAGIFKTKQINAQSDNQDKAISRDKSDRSKGKNIPQSKMNDEQRTQEEVRAKIEEYKQQISDYARGKNLTQEATTEKQSDPQKMGATLITSADENKEKKGDFETFVPLIRLQRGIVDKHKLSKKYRKKDSNLDPDHGMAPRNDKDFGGWKVRRIRNAESELPATSLEQITGNQKRDTNIMKISEAGRTDLSDSVSYLKTFFHPITSDTTEADPHREKFEVKQIMEDKSEGVGNMMAIKEFKDKRIVEESIAPESTDYDRENVSDKVGPKEEVTGAAYNSRVSENIYENLEENGNENLPVPPTARDERESFEYNRSSGDVEKLINSTVKTTVTHTTPSIYYDNNVPLQLPALIVQNVKEINNDTPLQQPFVTTNTAGTTNIGDDNKSLEEPLAIDDSVQTTKANDIPLKHPIVTITCKEKMKKNSDVQTLIPGQPVAMVNNEQIEYNNDNISLKRYPAATSMNTSQTVYNYNDKMLQHPDAAVNMSQPIYAHDIEQPFPITTMNTAQISSYNNNIPLQQQQQPVTAIYNESKYKRQMATTPSTWYQKDQAISHMTKEKITNDNSMYLDKFDVPNEYRADTIPSHITGTIINPTQHNSKDPTTVDPNPPPPLNNPSNLNNSGNKYQDPKSPTWPPILLDQLKTKLRAKRAQLILNYMKQFIDTLTNKRSKRNIGSDLKSDLGKLINTKILLYQLDGHQNSASNKAINAADRNRRSLNEAAVSLLEGTKQRNAIPVEFNDGAGRTRARSKVSVPSSESAIGQDFATEKPKISKKDLGSFYYRSVWDELANDLSYEGGNNWSDRRDNNQIFKSHLYKQPRSMNSKYTNTNDLSKEVVRARRGVDEKVDDWREGVNEIWTGLVEMREEEDLLKEFVQQNQKVVEEFKSSRKYLEEAARQMENMTEGAFDDLEYLVDGEDNEKVRNQSKISALFVEAIPKIEELVSNGIVKAQDIADSVEKVFGDLDANFNDSLVVSNETLKSAGENNKSDVLNRITQNVKEVFKLLLGVANVLSKQ